MNHFTTVTDEVRTSPPQESKGLLAYRGRKMAFVGLVDEQTVCLRPISGLF